MMMIKLPAHIPRQSIVHITLCLVGVLTIVFGGIVPAHRDGLRLEKKISDSRRMIYEDENLRPLYRSLQTVSGSARPGLPLPARAALPRTQIRKADAAVRNIAASSGMRVASLVPDLAAFTAASRSLAVNVSLSGGFANFRSVLIRLGELPYVERVEEFSIQRGRGAQALEVTMRILITVE